MDEKLANELYESLDEEARKSFALWGIMHFSFYVHKTVDALLRVLSASADGNI